MENEQKTKPRVSHPDRVTLSAEALSRLAGWISELDERLKGVKITKSQLTDFLILSHAAQLSETELELIRKDHFDEIRFGEWAVQQIREAKAQGRDITLAEIVGAQGSKTRRLSNELSNNNK